MREGVVTWAEIDLDAVTNNAREIKNLIGPQVQLIAVVKANAYGHGAVPVSRAVLAAGATWLAVHRLNEAEELREASITAPILLLGYVPPDGAEQVARLGLTPTVNTLEFAQALSDCATSLGRTARVHIKIDTGLSRFGVLPKEAVEFAGAVTRLPHLFLEGVYTHFATSDSLDPGYLHEQLDVFNHSLAELRMAEISPPLIHAANSGALLRFPKARFNAVRAGVSLYGMPPSEAWTPPVRLEPALSLKSLVARVRDLPAGRSVGYGRTFVASQPMRVALVMIGYGDGLHRSLSNKGSVLIRGRRAPLIGRVSMDQIVVDVTDIPGAAQDDEVVLIGRQGNKEITAGEVGRNAGTINYEVTTGLMPRVTRVYLGGAS